MVKYAHRSLEQSFESIEKKKTDMERECWKSSKSSKRLGVLVGELDVDVGRKRVEDVEPEILPFRES